MRSEVAKRILDNTPQETRERMRDYGEIIAVELSGEERTEAIFQAKLKKWFHERNRGNWPDDPYDLKR
jgi:hypothetical protein